MLEIIILIVSIILALLVLAYIIITFYTYNYIFKRAKREIPLLEVNLEKTHYAPYIDMVKEYNGYFDNLKSERISIKSHDNLHLVGDYYNNNSNKTVILVHGYKATPLNNFAVPGYMFYKQGYNLLMITQRAHGESEGKYITFGNLERKDLIVWINKVNELYNPESIVLYGVSMGAATIAMSTELSIPNNVKALVLDCGFTNAYDEIKHECKYSFHFVPHPILWGVKILTRLLGGFKIKEGNSEYALSKNNIPTIFIHGNKDKMVPFEMGIKNYQACNAEKEFIETNSGHAMSIYSNKDEIEEKVTIFLKKHVK